MCALPQKIGCQDEPHQSEKEIKQNKTNNSNKYTPPPNHMDMRWNSEVGDWCDVPQILHMLAESLASLLSVSVRPTDSLK